MCRRRFPCLELPEKHRRLTFRGHIHSEVRFSDMPLWGIECPNAWKSTYKTTGIRGFLGGQDVHNTTGNDDHTPYTFDVGPMLRGEGSHPWWRYGLATTTCFNTCLSCEPFGPLQHSKTTCCAQNLSRQLFFGAPIRGTQIYQRFVEKLKRLSISLIIELYFMLSFRGHLATLERALSHRFFRGDWP